MSNQFYNWFDWRSMTAATGMHIIFRQTKRQSHCRDCPLAFGDILILKLLIFLKCDFNLTVAR